MTQATKKSTVTIRLIGRTEEGFVFEEGDEPITFTMGDKNILEWVQKELVGMDEGDSKTIKLSPSQGYGEYHDDLIAKLDRSDFPKDLPLQINEYYELKDPSGGPAYAARIVNIEKSTVFLDTNHPLAGKNLIIDITLLKST